MESNPPAWFRRVGVSRNDLAKGIGQTVTVEGNRAKDGKPVATPITVIARRRVIAGPRSGAFGACVIERYPQ